MDNAKNILILVGSPRRDGNSAALARAVQKGAEQAAHTVKLRFIDDHISHFLRDCRLCRDDKGQCCIDDSFEQLFLQDYLPADGVVFCSPIYWYALSAQSKAFLDRSFCYYAASYPDADTVVKKMSGKRIALALAAEESYPGAELGIVHQIQEYARYTHGEFVGVVRGAGNRRNEIPRDPSDPISQAETLGRELFNRKYSDFRIDTPRAGNVWPQ